MSFSTKRILLVDDDIDICGAVKLLLNRSGFRVKTLNTMTDALRIARSEHFDLFILDTRLQDGTGLELCRSIRSFEQNTPILFHSASAYAEDKEKGLQAGAQAYLTKPVDFDALEQIVTQLVSADHLSQAQRSDVITST